MNTEALHHAIGARDAAIGHVPQCVRRGLGVQRHEIPEVSCALCACGISRSGWGFAAWMMSGNLMPSWMKNTGDVVAHQVEDTFVGVELGGETACVAYGVRRTS